MHVLFPDVLILFLCKYPEIYYYHNNNCYYLNYRTAPTYLCTFINCYVMTALIELIL